MDSPSQGGEGLRQSTAMQQAPSCPTFLLVALPGARERVSFIFMISLLVSSPTLATFHWLGLKILVWRSLPEL